MVNCIYYNNITNEKEILCLSSTFICLTDSISSWEAAQEFRADVQWEYSNLQRLF